MFARILILVLMMGCCGSTFSQKRIPVGIKFSSPELKSGATLFILKIFDAEKEVMNNKLIMLGDATSGFMQNFIETNSSNLNLKILITNNELSFRDESMMTSRNSFVEISGLEDSLRIFLNFSKGIDDNRLLSNVTITKFYDGTEMAELIPDWDFKIGSLPQYKIINKQEKLLYGSGYLNSFWSDYYYINKGKWETNPPLGICGTIGRQLPIEKGDTAYATLPTYIGIYEMAIKQPGEYIFTTEFSDSPSSEFVKPKDSNTLFTIKSNYLISTEFEIK
jgi:hypothetical protein